MKTFIYNKVTYKLTNVSSNGEIEYFQGSDGSWVEGSVRAFSLFDPAGKYLQQFFQDDLDDSESHQ